ncbi:hypothetical protein AUJ69_00605 [Candidatus Woesearchaeota archaeon CG1_02_47_18]|nr:MAG: hypothetical protein AUJ69_00605 [Candidatus Woesearchaeota archaeon CG1_02_47_18]
MINFKLRKQILEEIPEIKKCFQCGSCTSGCLAAKYLGAFSPREKIIRAATGDKQVLSSELWKCASCNNCNERCPQGVNPFEVLLKLKNIAIRMGLAPEELVSKAREVIEQGYIVELNKMVQENRTELGLPELEPVEENKKLCEGL